MHIIIAAINIFQLLSGQNFIIPNKKTSTMEILYQTYGIPQDCELLKHTVTSVRNDNL